MKSPNSHVLPADWNRGVLRIVRLEDNGFESSACNHVLSVISVFKNRDFARAATPSVFCWSGLCARSAAGRGA